MRLFNVGFLLALSVLLPADRRERCVDFQNAERPEILGTGDASVVEPKDYLYPIQSRATLSGVVTDALSDPKNTIPEVAINLYSSERVIQARSDAEGRFQLVDVPLGTYQLEASRSGFKSRKIPLLRIEAVNVQPLAITLQVANASCTSEDSISYKEDKNGRTVAGIVRDSNHPLANVKIDLFQMNDPGVVESQRSDKRGEFQFSGLTPGEYVIEVSHDGYRSVRTASFWMTRENLTDVAIEMTKNKMFRVCQ